MSLIDDFFSTEEALHRAFGYVEDWHLYTIQDHRDVWWAVEYGMVRFEEAEEGARGSLATGEWTYSFEIHRDRFLRGETEWHFDGCTMILVDTHTDGNKYLAVFDDAKRVAP